MGRQAQRDQERFSQRRGKNTANRRFVLGIMAIGFLFIVSGCGSLILAHQYYVGLDAPPSAAFPLVVNRKEVEERLGKPASSRALPDGGRVDTYDYTLRDPNWLVTGAVLGSLSAASWGFMEIGFVPMAVYEVWKNRHTATFTYGPDDRFVNHGPPPPYGPADNVLDPLSHEDIRERCRSEHPVKDRDVQGGAVKQPLPFRDYAYRDCVVQRLAIWGLE